MKKIILSVKTLIFLFLFSACTGNEVNKDCFSCQETLTEYCIVEGEDFYTISVDGTTPQEIPLNGEFWNDIKDTVNYECGADCFTCDDTQTTYCYQNSNDFYTVHIEGSSSNEVLLNGQSWEEIKTDLENGCSSNQPISIIGTWELIDYGFTTQTTTIISGNNIVTGSITIGITYNSTETYTDNPNESQGEGISILQTTITDENGEETVIDDIELEILNSTFWEINGNLLTKTIDGENQIIEILELTDSNLSYKANIIFEDEDLDGNLQTNVWETISTFTRQ